MEQPCYKCGQAVEEGVAFCPHCAAPQIRVVVSEPAPDVPQPAGAAAASPHAAVLPTPHAAPPIALPMRLSDAVKPCALAALVAALLMVLGLNPFVAVLSVGFLAVVFYRQRQPGTPVGAGTGARLGAVAGLLWFGMSVILQGFAVVVLRKGPEMRAEMLTKIQQAAAGTNDPQVQAMLEYFKTPAGLAVLIIFALIFAFFAALVLSTAGGAIGGSILGRRNKP